MSITAPPVWAEVPAPPPPPAAAQPAILQPLLVMAGLGAAAIHFAFAPMHLDADTVQGAFFVVVAWAQLGWAIAIARKPSPLVYRLGIVLNGGVLAVWLVSRTIGIDGVVEPWGFPDSVAAGLEVFMILGSFGPLTRRLPSTSMRELTAGAVLGASALAVTALVSASMTPSLSGHGSSGAAAGATDHHGNPIAGDTPAEEPVVAKPYDPAQPVDLGGVPGVSAKEQADAESIVTETLAGLPQWADPAAAVAAGFRSIGDSGTGTEHYINQDYMDDDIVLDPDKPESLVYDVDGDKRTLGAAMYMLKTGTPLSEAPKTGGKLMQWHTHQNLCYNAQGRVAGVTDGEGNCREGLVKPPETPMIHVWIRKHPCGPFAALEGIGAGTIAEGEERLCDSAHGS